MSLFIKQMILTKLRQITPEDVLHYGKEYGFSISRKQAEEISNYVRKKRIDPFNEDGRKKILHDLSQITDRNTAIKANKLFQELIKSYGLEHLFE